MQLAIRTVEIAYCAKSTAESDDRSTVRTVIEARVCKVEKARTAVNDSRSVISGLESPTPWLTVTEAATRARCGPKTIYREVRAGSLRAARIGGRRELRLLAEWIDEWLVRNSTVVDASATMSRRSI